MTTAVEWPSTGRVTQAFGHNRHPGTDFGAAMGDPIYAMADGEIIYAGPASGFGLAVALWHPDLGVSTTYGHMYRFEAGIATGAHVERGRVLAPTGSNGFSTGPHLHFEVRAGRVPFGNMDRNTNPEPFLIGRHADPAGTHSPLSPGGNRWAYAPTLRQGSSGPDVEVLQDTLNRLTHAGLLVDGAFGPATARAVVNFERFCRDVMRVAGMTVDAGICGPQCWKVLDAMMDLRGW